jgi:hypothetical protein
MLHVPHVNPLSLKWRARRCFPAAVNPLYYLKDFSTLNLLVALHVCMVVSLQSKVRGHDAAVGSKFSTEQGCYSTIQARGLFFTRRNYS